MSKILVDTCIWAVYFKKSQSVVRRHIDELLDEDQLVLIGPVLTELLVGFKRKAQADWVASLGGDQLVGLETRRGVGKLACGTRPFASNGRSGDFGCRDRPRL